MNLIYFNLIVTFIEDEKWRIFLVSFSAGKLFLLRRTFFFSKYVGILEFGFQFENSLASYGFRFGMFLRYWYPIVYTFFRIF